MGTKYRLKIIYPVSEENFPQAHSIRELKYDGRKGEFDSDGMFYIEKGTEFDTSKIPNSWFMETE